MESKFYIGQKVVAIENHSEGDYSEGDIFTIIDIKKGCCCFEVKINNDLKLYKMKCVICDIEEWSTAYYYEKNFAPIQEQYISEMTYEDAIELVTQKQLV